MLVAAVIASTLRSQPANAQPSASARALANLPARIGANASALPAVRGDRLEIRLAPAAAAEARSRRPGRTGWTTALGARSIDAAASAAGVLSFEPEFPGETPPAPDSPDADFTSFYIARLAPGADLDQALRTLRSTPGVASVSRIPILRVSAVPNDSLWAQSWWYFDAAGRNDVHAPEAWDVSTGDATIVVGILDTGVIPYHPDLGGTLAGDPGLIWTNAAEANGVPGVDDDGNGYVDDAHGWDFVETSSVDLAPGEDGEDADNDPNDFSGHGTAVAGLVGALTNNVRGVAGTNWNVRLMPLRMAWSEQGGAGLEGVVDMAYAAQALRYATRMGAHVVNASFQTLDTDGLYAAAAAATRAGVVIVSAAGNGDVFHELQDREDVIAVAATDQDDHLAFFTNLGDFVDLAAPGVGVGSTFVRRTGRPDVDSLSNREPRYIVGLNGTSFSSPLVAGGVALMLAREKALGAPPLRPMEALFRMRETADDLQVASPGADGYGGGRLNLARALTERDVSFAVHAASASVGAPAVLATSQRSRRIVVATSDAHLVVMGDAGDTVRVVDLPGLPLGSPAAADMGGGYGAAMFVTIAGGTLAGFDGSGVVLPGWPVSVADQGVEFAYSPVLADVDGDGARDVVCATTDGSVQAFDFSGVSLPTFPIATDGSGLAAPIAVAELDTVPGADVLVPVLSNRVYALHAKVGGPRVTGWPRTVPGSPRAPLVARLTGRPTACVVVGFGSTVRLLETNGALRADLAAPGTLVQDPVAADLDGDGFDELIVATAGPDAIAALDSVADASTWTHALPGSTGPPIVRGHGGAGADGAQVMLAVASPISPDVGAPVRSRFRGFDGAGAPLSLFPKAGSGVAQATAFGVDSFGTARLVAGSGADSLIYFYRVPRPVLAGDAGWFTARANFARTGSRMESPSLGVVDDSADRVADLAAIAVTETTVTLRWTVPGDVGVDARPRSYDVRASLAPISSDATFDAAPLRREVIATVDPGGIETFTFGGLEPATHYYFVLKPWRFPRSNQAQATTVSPGVSLTVKARPSRLPVEFSWRGAGAGGPQHIRIYDLSGRRLVELPLTSTTAGGAVQWNGRDEGGRLVPAGIYFARLTSGSFHAQTRVVLLP